jgi:hypothetical protein
MPKPNEGNLTFITLLMQKAEDLERQMVACLSIFLFIMQELILN